MTHPIETSIAVAKPNSSAPRSAPITTSRPVFIWPSTWILILSLKPLRRRVCWVSARPSSHGRPACFMLVSGEAPVPPSCPLISTMSARPFATPAATVPTPASETSFTETRAASLAFLKSYMSCAKSSIEYMSWCGGGEMRETPGVEWRIRAMSASTLCPGSWPPSPGFAPWATFI